MYTVLYRWGKEKHLDRNELKTEINRQTLHYKPIFFKGKEKYELIENNDEFNLDYKNSRLKQIRKSKKIMIYTLLAFSLIALLSFSLDASDKIPYLSYIFSIVVLGSIDIILVNNIFCNMFHVNGDNEKEIQQYFQLESLLCNPSPISSKVTIFFLSVVLFEYFSDLNSHTVEPLKSVIRMVEHKSILHLMFNAYALLTCMRFIEVLYGRRVLLLSLLISILVNSLTFIFFIQDTIGFSGVVFSLIGFLFFSLKRFNSRIHFYDICIWIVIMSFIGLIGFQYVSNITHLCGFIIGISIFKFAEARQWL